MKKILLLAFLTTQVCFAQWTEFYVRTNGSNLNAGSTESTTPTFTAAGGDWNGTVWTKTGVDLSNVDVGMWASVYPDSTTTTTPYVAVITAVDDGADTITLSTTSKSGTAPTTSTADDVSIAVEGAWKGMDSATVFPFGFVQNSMTNPATAETLRVNFKNDNLYDWQVAGTHANVGPMRFQGYTTTPGDLGKAIFTGINVPSGTPFQLLEITGDGIQLVDLWFRDNYVAPQAGAQSTGNYILELSSRAHLLLRVKVSGGYRGGISYDGSGTASATLTISSEIFNCQYDDANLFGLVDILEECYFKYTVFHGSGNVMRAGAAGTQSCAIDLANGLGEPVIFDTCIIARNQGDGCLPISTGNALFINSDFFDNGRSGTGDGIDMTTMSIAAQNYMTCINTRFVDNDGYAVRNDATATSYPLLINCGFGLNGDGETLNINSAFIINKVQYTSNPYVDAPNGDFTRNDTVDGGALDLNTGYNTFTIDTTQYSEGANTIGYNSIGAVQSQQGASSGSGGQKSFIIVK